MTNKQIIEKIKRWLQNNLEHRELSNATRHDSKLLLQYIERLQNDKG